jgi:hypothetical protein
LEHQQRLGLEHRAIQRQLWSSGRAFELDRIRKILQPNRVELDDELLRHELFCVPKHDERLHTVSFEPDCQRRERHDLYGQRTRGQHDLLLSGRGGRQRRQLSAFQPGFGDHASGLHAAQPGDGFVCDGCFFHFDQFELDGEHDSWRNVPDLPLDD